MAATHRPEATDLPASFAVAMDRLGPFEPQPRLAIAVSGGADSTALAILAKNWTTRRNGEVLALVVDHGLRPDSAAEAALTIDRLVHQKIHARLLPLTTLTRGPALAERARIERYRILSETCRTAGYRHLLLGHHAADQIETVAMRVLRGSHTHGLAGMAALREADGIRLLRPLLTIQPALLRHYLTERGIAWVEDPSNHDLCALRPRLRHLLATHTPDTVIPPLLSAISAVGRLRADEEARTAAELAIRATIHPAGFALLTPGRISEAALSALVQTISGALYPPPVAQIAPLAAYPKPATIAGTRFLPAGRLGNALLIIREESAIAAPVAANSGTLWDNRFRLTIQRGTLTKATIGMLGSDASHFRALTALPSAVLRTLPALKIGNFVAAVPHLSYARLEDDVQITVQFAPGKPFTGLCFTPAY